ncbi:MAG TPA: non-canonical purine NTP pyrophosphatase [Candidatus Saccharimonadia bacterium]|nr:non-canonical purine NTP pyrophosphatase [Candidatus Saccharimonadia bacterium]
MALYFITGNAGKFGEIQALIPDIIQLKLDVDEIQSLDPQVVIAHKLEQAARHHDGEFIVEDTSLALNCLNGLPGPLIKWFEEAIGLPGIGELAAKYDDQTAVARTTIGYRNQQGQTRYVTGEIAGRIVLPRGAGGFGWDDIFVPEGYDKTFSELGPEIKGRISMRRRAAEQLVAFLA